MDYNKDVKTSCTLEYLKGSFRKKNREQQYYLCACKQTEASAVMLSRKKIIALGGKKTAVV